MASANSSSNSPRVRPTCTRNRSSKRSAAARHASSSGSRYEGLIRSRAKRTRTRLPLSMMLPPPFAGDLLRGAAGHDFVQNRLFLAVFAEQAAQALNVLAHAAAAGEDDADARGRYVHALVADLA